MQPDKFQFESQPTCETAVNEVTPTTNIFKGGIARGCNPTNFNLKYNKRVKPPSTRLRRPQTYLKAELPAGATRCNLFLLILVFISERVFHKTARGDNMDDKKIIGLYFSRDESAISETDKKYGKLCRYIAYHILYNEQDSEECVNDTYLRAWSNMPPKKPSVLSAFLGRITRNIAINRALYDNAKKRGGEFLQISDEALEIVSGNDDYCENMAIKEAINGFLAKLPLRTRVIFMRRYWYMSSIKEIAEDYGIPEGTVKSILSRTRQEFKNHLLKEGIAL